MRGDKDTRYREEVDRLGRPTIEMLDREIVRLDKNESYRRLMLDVLVGLLVAVAAIIIVTNLWLAVLQVDGSSMNPRLQMDDIVLAVRTDQPAKNDVIAFYNNNRIYVKRVIALGGDTVSIGADGTVSVNGRALSEPYVTAHSLGDSDLVYPYQVPSGTVFVLGDNRPTAIDSRNSTFGTISKDKIIGRIVFRLWPFMRIGITS
ncbi:MAG: signal peptidase I [Coriobacteriia bacterium]|nr:signal peptidase I [Coriobacteriia bacterium]